ncbi:MAG: hypothetical protein AAFQ47_10135 [Pseudomonadota bacterium]
MTTTIYQRPTGLKATSIGDRNRRRYSRHLRRRIFDLLRPIDFMVAEETVISDAAHRQRNSSRDDPWQDRPKWVTTRIRTDQMALIGLLQKRHLKSTGKEISKAEVLAALMATGLEHVLDHPDFSGEPA